MLFFLFSRPVEWNVWLFVTDVFFKKLMQQIAYLIQITIHCSFQE